MNLRFVGGFFINDSISFWGTTNVIRYVSLSKYGVFIASAAPPVIWVATAGRKSIHGATISTTVLVRLPQALAVYGSQYALILLGGMLLMVVLPAPQGLLPYVVKHLQRFIERSQQRAGFEPQAAFDSGRGRSRAQTT
jgi:hypothetical protein